MEYRQLENSTKIILKVAFVLLALVFLWMIRDILLLLLLALILASAMDPMVNYFKRHKIPRTVSVLAVYILFMGLVALVTYLIVPVVVDQFKIFLTNLPGYSNNLHSRFGSLLGSFDFSNFLGQELTGITGGGTVVSSTFGIFNGFINIVAVLVISFYLVAEENGMKAFISTLIPAAHREFTIGIVEKVQKKMGLWILGQLIAIVVMFVITWIGLSILRVPYALILAVLAGVLEVVPYIGPFLSAIPAVFIGLIQSPALALAVILLYLLLHELEGYILIPKIMEKTVGTSPLAVLLALLIGFKLAGVVGLLVSVPVVGAITVVVNELWPRPAAV